MQKKHSLCWDCAKACGRCSWSNYREHLPVPGWLAETTKLRMNNNTYADTFLVIDCPEFERDGLKGGQYRIRRNEKNEQNLQRNG